MSFSYSSAAGAARLLLIPADSSASSSSLPWRRHFHTHCMPIGAQMWGQSGVSIAAPANRCSQTRTTRPFRSLRRRPDADDCYVQLDWSKGTRENVREILYKVVSGTDSPKASKLAYLNCFAKIGSKIAADVSADGLGFLPEEVFCCLRVALLDEAYEVRAAGLRAMRFFIKDDERIAGAFVSSNQIHLVIRSLDINLDNKIERLQALRLIRRLIAVLPPAEMPVAAVRALVSIARDGSQERDALTRPALAAITELCLRHPAVAAVAGCFSTIAEAVLQPNTPHSISESLIGTLVYTLNDPSLRHHLKGDQDLHHFCTAFTDCYTLSPTVVDHTFETLEQRQMKFLASKRAIVALLRSWPGLIYFCRRSCDASQCRGSNAIQSLIETLHMPYEDTRRSVLELLFELLSLRVPVADKAEEFSFEDILSSYMWSSSSTAHADAWQIYDGFVAAEGRNLLPHVSRTRLNLFDNYLSIVLYALVSYGVIEALVQVIITPPKTGHYSNSVRATVLLAEILHLSSRLLPHEVYQKCHSLPDLMNAATTSPHPLEVRGIASTAIAALDRIHALRNPASVVVVVPCSLFLGQLIHFANLSSLPKHTDTKSRLQLKQSVAHETDQETISNYIRDSNVLSSPDCSSYNWGLIANVLSWPTAAFRRLEDPSFRMFMKSLLVFFKPSGRGFAQTDINDERGREVALVCCHFVEFLLDIADARSAEFLGDFLTDLADCLSVISVPNPPANAILSSSKLMTTLSQFYFLVIGRMTSSNKGSKLLEQLGIYQCLSALVAFSCHDVYAKLIISSLDYTRDGLYATNFFVVLLRVGVPDFHKWAVELLVSQLYDESDSISLAAAEVLLESCDQKRNLEELITLRPSLLHAKHAGLLLQIRFASLPTGIKYLTEANVMDALVQEWRRSYNLKYVRIVEDVMNESLTLHFRSEGGTYGRRSEKKTAIDRNTFLPPHLYGQLALTEIGIKLLNSGDCLSTSFRVIRNQDLTSERKILEMKASLWAVGHVASCALGLPLVVGSDNDIIPLIAKMAADCDILSLRGTSVYTLGLIAMTEQGVRQLHHLGWIGLQHERNVWPLISDRQEDHSNMFHCFKRKSYSCSVSSVGTRLTDDRRPFSPDYEQDGRFSYTQEENPEDNRSRASSLGVYLSVRSAPEQACVRREEMEEAKARGSHASHFPAEAAASSEADDENKSRSGSCNNDTSIVSSGISVSSCGGLSLGKSVPKLSPIASISSTSNCYNIQSCYATYHMLVPALFLPPKDSTANTITCCITASDRPHHHAHHLPSDSTPSSADAHGYATLRAINRTRDHSIPSSESWISAGAASMAPDCAPASTSSCCSLSANAGISNGENDKFSDGKAPFSSVHLSSEKFIEAALDSAASECDHNAGGEAKTLIGIVIPFSLDLLFESPASPARPYRPLSSDSPPSGSPIVVAPPTPAYRTHMDTMPPQSVCENDGLELHTMGSCLQCYRFQTAAGAEEGQCQSPALLSAGDLHEAVRASSSRASLMPHPLKHIISASSMTSTSSTEGVAPSDPLMNQLLIRREVLRFVTNLSGSVAAKAAEQGMLNLKQRFPGGFQDICLYSEICLQLATYNFRLPARKFIQEIFQDINFEPLRVKAKEILKKKASRSLQELEDESSDDRGVVGRRHLT